MLSKSKGQILRVAATLHVLFHMDKPLEVPYEISLSAIKAATNFMDMCHQHAAFIAGRGDLNAAIETIKEGLYNYLHVLT